LTKYTENIVHQVVFIYKKLNMSSVWHNYTIFYYYSTIRYKFRPQKAIIRPIFTTKNFKCWCMWYKNVNFMGSNW